MSNAFKTTSTNDDGKQWISKITLDPHIVWIGDAPTAEVLAAMHHEAHEVCYIANSIKSEVVVSEPGAVATG